MSPAFRALRLLVAFVRRDVLVEASYRAALIFSLFSAGLQLASTWFLGQAVGPDAAALRPWGGDYFAFATVGLALSGPLHVVQHAFAGHVREAQLEGTLEPVLVTPVPLAHVVAYQAAWGVVSACLRASAFLLAAVLLLGLPIRASGLPVALLAFALGMLAHAALGMLSAAFTLLMKRGDPVGWVVESVSVLLAGVLFPVAVLPAPLRAAGAALPLTHVLEVARRALLLDTPVADLARPLGMLAALAVGLLLVASVTFRAALRRARDEGSLTHY